MTFNQFKKLPQERQELAMWYKGEPVADRTDRFFRYQLVQLDGFYVEIIYSLRFNIIHCISAFDDTEFLEPYLQEINIDLF